ncbi:WD40-repeat-containing domain protein [Chiua virens]|nr:WD40-repeat-containing domain protein [Chiua virens]
MRTPSNRAPTVKVIDGRDYISSVVFTADGKRILAGGTEGKIRCWGIDDGKEVKKPIDVRSSVLNIGVSQDGTLIVSGAQSGVAQVFDMESGELVMELNGHVGGGVTAVDVSLDRRRIATGSDGWSANNWSLSSSGQLQLQRLPQDGDKVLVAKFSPNGLLLATATVWYVWIYESDSGRHLADFNITASSSLLHNQSVAWHHDSRHLFVTSSDGHIHHLDVLTKATLSKWRIHDDYNPWCIALASDSAYIAASTGGSVSFWNAVTHEQIGSPIWLADTISSMAISSNHNIVVSAGKTITVQNLHSVLPAHHCDNTARNLHTDLTNLQRRYKAQSRKFCQITALKAELDHRKRAVAIKMDRLATVRRELDQLPDLSHEVVVARNELRWSEARTHDIHQWYSHQPRDIASAVADSQSESPAIHQSITGSDSSAEKGIVHTLEHLNAAIQRTSMTVSTYFIHHIKIPDTEEQSSAARHASDSIPQSLVDCLLTLPRHNLPLYLPIALRAYITSYLHMIISSWTSDRGADELIGKMYERMCKLGEFSINHHPRFADLDHRISHVRDRLAITDRHQYPRLHRLGEHRAARHARPLRHHRRSRLRCFYFRHTCKNVAKILARHCKHDLSHRETQRNDWNRARG